jgi:hypothetical protein
MSLESSAVDTKTNAFLKREEEYLGKKALKNRILKALPTVPFPNPGDGIISTSTVSHTVAVLFSFIRRTNKPRQQNTEVHLP